MKNENGWMLIFTIWDETDCREVQVEELLIGKTQDQAWVEAICLWKAELKQHHWYTGTRIIPGKQPQVIDYPRRPYIERRKQLFFE